MPCLVDFCWLSEEIDGCLLDLIGGFQAFEAEFDLSLGGVHRYNLRTETDQVKIRSVWGIRACIYQRVGRGIKLIFSL